MIPASAVAVARPPTTRAGGAANTARPTSRTLSKQESSNGPGYHGGGRGQREIGRGRAPRAGCRAAGAGGEAAAGAVGAEGEAGGVAGRPPGPVGVLPRLRRG